MRPSQAYQVLEDLRNSFSGPLFRKGVELSLDDNQTVKDVYQQWLMLMIDLDYLAPDTLKRDAGRLWFDLNHSDVFSLNNAFAECLHLVRIQTNKGFKGLCSAISPHLYSLIKDDVNKIALADVFAAKRLVQLFSYTSRLSLRDIDLTQQLLDEYHATEDRLTLDYDPSLIRRLNRIIKRWIGPYQPDCFLPGHGPGGVAGHGRCSLEVKYLDLTTDPRLEYTYGKCTWAKEGIRSNLDRMSQTIFVPKSYKTFRTISMEPATLQYFQQGIWKNIDKQVNTSRYLRNHIGFHDQTRNKRLAQQGSIDRDFATIDLSSASDSVSYVLVKQLFRGTWLSRHLLATRSTKTLLPDGSSLRLKKFAPMGSALCFPVETLIFAAVCEDVTRKYRVPGQYSVFGDDIIVPTNCVEALIETLLSLDFLVNREKSFYQQDCWFRESCGGEYCDGYDVTPMRVSRTYANNEQDVKFTKLIEMANSAFKKNFQYLRYFFVRKLRESSLNPLFAPTSLMSDNYTNYHAKKRWNKNLQRIDVFVSMIHSKNTTKNLSSQNEEIRYRHWFEATASRTSLGDGYQSVICKPTVFVKETWMNKPFEDLDQVFIDESTRRDNFPSL